MTVSRYRLTRAGWLGAAMFILPTPIGVWMATPPKLTLGEVEFQKMLAEISGSAPQYMPSLFWMTVLTVFTMIGFVLLLVGREIETVKYD